MDSNPDLNLSASGDENNQTILLDTTASPEKSNNDDSPVEIEKEVTPPQSTGSLRMLDLNDSNDEELLSRSNNLTNDSGDQLSKKNEESKEPKIDKDEPVVSNVVNEEEDDASLLEIVPVKPKKPDELDEDDVEETIVERLIGLTEMFPDRVRNVGYSILTGTFPLVKRTYNLTRTISWVFFSSFALLVVPVSLEKERCQAQRDLSRQMLLGGGSQPAGPGQVGMAPAPVSK